MEADDPLLGLEAALVETTHESQKSMQKEGCGMTFILQGIIYHVIARPVIKSRIFMAGKYPMLALLEKV